MHVEEHEVGRSIEDRVDGLEAVAGFADDVDVGFDAEQRPHALARQRLVVDDERANLAWRDGHEQCPQATNAAAAADGSRR